MNLASFLLCLLFAFVGYALYPSLLPKMVESKMVAESSLSDSYKEEQAKKALPEADDTKKPEEGPKPVEPEIIVEKPVVPAAPVPAPVIPAPAPAPVAPKVVAKLNDQEFITALQSSVKAGDVNEFKFDHVVDWKRVGEELIGSDNYDVGMITYNAQTIFGEQPLQAKALIKDGKVVKWLWPATNTEMR